MLRVSHGRRSSHQCRHHFLVFFVFFHGLDPHLCVLPSSGHSFEAHGVKHNTCGPLSLSLSSACSCVVPELLSEHKSPLQTRKHVWSCVLYTAYVTEHVPSQEVFCMFSAQVQISGGEKKGLLFCLLMHRFQSTQYWSVKERLCLPNDDCSRCIFVKEKKNKNIFVPRASHSLNKLQKTPQQASLVNVRGVIINSQ